jgi:type IV secretory pathway VirB6-like protein
VYNFTKKENKMKQKYISSPKTKKVTSKPIKVAYVSAPKVKAKKK